VLLHSLYIKRKYYGSRIVFDGVKHYFDMPLDSGVPRGVVWGVQTPPRNSEDIGEVLDRVRKKNRRLDFLL